MIIAVVDQYPLIRTGLGAYVKVFLPESEISIAESVLDFTTKYPGLVPDLILLAISQGGRSDNIGLIRLVRNQYLDANLIAYDEMADHSRISDYLKEGIKGYLSKQDPLSEIQVCIEAVLSGGQYVCKGDARR